MITNERQYKITKGLLARFEESLRELRGSPPPEGADPLIWRAEGDAVESQVEEMREDLAAYEALRSGSVRAFRVASLGDLPKVLIQARIAEGLTQRELGLRLGVREQQVQQDEEALYASASLRRLRQVAEVLGVELEGQAHLAAK